MAKNKVKYGLKNVHVWPVESETTETVTYGTAIKIPGAVSISLKASSKSDSFYADNTVYFSSFGNSGYEGDLEIAIIPEEFEVQILGAIKDKNNAIVEGNGNKAKNYAIGFEFDGDQTQTRHILYNCSSSRPDVESETVGEGITPKTDKLSIKAVPALDTGYVKAKLSKGDTGYDDFFTTPYKVVLNPGV